MRLAFVGGFGHHYLKGALKDPAIQIDRPVAFAPSGADDDRAQSAAHAAGDARYYPDINQLLDDFRPDVVNIGGIYARNGDLAAAALERDIPVVSDKPVAATWQQLERLRKLTDGNKRVLLTEFDFHSRATFRAARDAIRAGKIGTPVLATAQKSYRYAKRPPWYADRSLYGGTMLWIASHGIDAVRFATGKKITAVTGRQGNVTRPEMKTMEEYTTTLLELEGGGSGIVHADYFRPDQTKEHGDDRLRVAGSKGVVEVRGGRCTLLGEDGVEQDITDQAKVQPIHVELLAAARRESDDLYSTAASLEIAAVLLHARDAADKQEWVKCGQL